MTDGTGSGAGGDRLALTRGYAVIAILVVVAGTVNVLSALHDAGRRGGALDWWEPAIWEGTSAVAILAFAWLAWLAVRIGASPAIGRIASLGLHVAAALAFSLAHVATMVALRIVAYALAGASYSFGDPGPEFLYELRKDLVSYLLLVGTFWVSIRLHSARSPGPPDQRGEPQPAFFDIRDGARVVRVPVAEIVAVQSAGNYVEFILSGGRRELMRTTLATIAQELAAHGVVRTHRSWLVNPLHVREVVGQGSGDYQITMSDGVVVPQSRRFRRTASGPSETGSVPVPGS